MELLFDLVSVLGVSQLTRHLVARPTWRGAAERLVLYLPMFAEVLRPALVSLRKLTRLT